MPNNLRTYTADYILRGDREILIDHNGMIYKLRQTDANRLILNKPSEEFPPPETIRTIISDDLLQGDREALVTHGNEVYRLLVTEAGKLIFNK